MYENESDQQNVFINPIEYYGDCGLCIFKKLCEVKWRGVVPYHVDNGGECPDEFEFNINNLDDYRISP